MPQYENQTENNITPVGGKTYSAGETSDHLRDYFKKPKGMTLVQHGGAGYAGIQTVISSLPSSSVELFRYDFFRITNGTDAVITLTFNEDSANPDYLLSEQTMEVWNTDPRNYHSVVIAGSGSGSVYIRGWR